MRLRFSGRDDLIDTVRNSGTTHWFDQDTMRFFRSRVSETLYAGGRVFVTGETAPSGVRRYTVRVLSLNENGDRYDVKSVSGHGAYASLSGAHSAASRVQRAMRDKPFLFGSHLTDGELDVLADLARVSTENGFY